MDVLMLSFVILVVMFLLLALGFPIAFTMSGLAIFGTIYVWGWAGLYMVVSTTFANSNNFIYIAIPLFLLMANFLQSSGMGDDMYEIIYRWAGKVRGGLASGTVVISGIFGAMSGISSVATVTMGLIAAPSMMKRGYDRSMVLGSIMAGGTLGILIPPSIIMVVYAGVAEVSVGKLFMGGVLPGILLIFLYIGYISIYCWIKPEMGPPVDTSFSFREKIVALKGFALPVLLIFLVLGLIYTGVATPTEAAGIGAFGAFLCMAAYGRATYANVKKALVTTLSTNAMIMWIIMGASCFSHFIAVAGIHDVINEALTGLDIWRWWIVIFMQGIFFILGMFLNPAAIVMLCGPLFVPIIVDLGFDPLWFGILFVINMEMGYLTPPFGLNLFIMKGIMPPSVTMAHIYVAIIPFLFLQGLCLALVMVFPQLALWLSSMMV